ncbi:MAG: hypothetical protein LUG54_03800 [Clostridiales bacterium]|nr:hypothetical protein [Clostridiales bacterium]
MGKDLFFLNTDTCWGLFLVSDSHYPLEFRENVSCVTYLNADDDIEKTLLEKIGRNQLVKNNVVIPRDIGKIFRK